MRAGDASREPSGVGSGPVVAGAEPPEGGGA